MDDEGSTREIHEWDSACVPGLCKCSKGELEWFRALSVM
jgi:hypothetical protein